MFSASPSPLFIGVTIALILIVTAVGIMAVRKAKKEM